MRVTEHIENNFTLRGSESGSLDSKSPIQIITPSINLYLEIGFYLILYSHIPYLGGKDISYIFTAIELSEKV